MQITRTAGSAPREAGTWMLVGATEVHGTIGGGHLEWEAIALARGLLAGAGAASPIERYYALGPTLGQCCGGTVDLRIERLAAAHLERWPKVPPRFVLQLYGAGHVGRAIVDLLRGLPCRVQWIDEREDQFPAGLDLPPHIERVCVEPVEAEVAVAPPGACYLVLTHSHDLDLAIGEAILKRGDFGFFGLIGSQTKRARFRHRYRDRGIAQEIVDRMVCPIGLPGITGKEPEVIAVAAVAQLLQQSQQMQRTEQAQLKPASA